MTIRLDDTNIVMHDIPELFSKGNKEIINEYINFIEISDESNYLMLDEKKKLIEKIYYRRLFIKSENLLKFKKFFTSWRK